MQLLSRTWTAGTPNENDGAAAPNWTGAAVAGAPNENGTAGAGVPNAGTMGFAPKENVFAGCKQNIAGKK